MTNIKTLRSSEAEYMSVSLLYNNNVFNDSSDVQHVSLSPLETPLFEKIYFQRQRSGATEQKINLSLKMNGGKNKLPLSMLICFYGTGRNEFSLTNGFIRGISAYIHSSFELGLGIPTLFNTSE